MVFRFFSFFFLGKGEKKNFANDLYEKNLNENPLRL